MQRTCKELANMLAQRAEGVAHHLLPNGKRNGHEWKVGDILGGAGNSLSVCLAGDKAGIWSDFATGEAGDLLNLWEKVRGLSLKETLFEVKSWLGITDTTFYSRPTTKNAFKRPQMHSSEILPQEVADYLCNQRRLSKSTLASFKVQGQGHEIILPYWRNDQLLQIKHLKIDRPEGKKQIRVEKDCEPSLFGWQAVPKGARTIAITEGEIDAMSLYEYGISALSVPFGGGQGQKQAWIEYEFENLSHFDEVYLCLDQDEVGQQTAEYLAKRLGLHRCKVVKLPFKDANECLVQGVEVRDIRHCFDSAMGYDPEELKSPTAYAVQVLKRFSGEFDCAGVSSPWSKAQGIRFREGELSVWTGINGHGKSQFLGQLALHCMQQGKRICIASLEMQPASLIYRLIRQGLAQAQPCKDAIIDAHDYLDSRLWIFDLVGSAKTNRLLEVFAYAKKRYGIDIFIIDSLMKCGLSEDDYKAQKLFVEALCDFKNQYDCHIHLVAHPRKDQNESSLPGKMDVKGTGAITDLADNCFTIWRNKGKKQGQYDQPDCMWSCDKQRNGDFEGKIGLYFDVESYQFLEDLNKPFIYIN